MVDRRTAEAIQLRLEYNPAPPFNAGSPDTAPPEILALMKERIAPAQARRSEAIHRAAARLAIRRGGTPRTDSDCRRSPQQKKAARFPRRPFLSYGSYTLTGDFRTSSPGAYLPATS